MSFDDLPTNLLERARMLENVMTARAVGDMSASNFDYQQLRQGFVSDPELKDLLPEFVRTCRSLDVFWPYIKKEADTYAGRRGFIGQAFTPLIDHLEGNNRSPGDGAVSDALEKFDADSVRATWAKALARRNTDPEGAITAARTLLESVSKHILDMLFVEYSDKDDLPKLYALVAKELNLAPDQHTEVPIKQILGGAMNVANGIGTLRNRLSDSHGRGAANPVKPSPRHAALAVNMAGALAAFLVETYDERQNEA